MTAPGSSMRIVQCLLAGGFLVSSSSADAADVLPLTQSAHDLRRQLKATAPKYVLKELKFVQRETKRSEGGGSMHEEEAFWRLVLHPKGQPKNLLVRVTLPSDHSGQPRVQLAEAVGAIDRYLKPVTTISWLMEHLRTHPQTVVQLEMAGARSFARPSSSSWSEAKELAFYRTPELERLMRPDRTAATKTSEVAERSPQPPLFGMTVEMEQFLQQVSVLEVIEPDYRNSSWLLLPDGQMMLWVLYGDGAFGWSRADFLPWSEQAEEVRRALVGDRGSPVPFTGTSVTPAGELVRR